MRFKIMRQGGYGSTGISELGGNMTGPLVLSGDPTQPLQASTKGYVDSALNNLNAASLTSGTIPVDRLPAFTGDVVNLAGTNSFSLMDAGITPGTYPKVTVNAKGRITNGFLLSLADIPNLDWNKVTTGKPTTVNGYGITNAISPNGGTMTGSLSVTGTPTAPLHIVTKGYIDALTAGAAGGAINVGDVVRKVSSTTPTGFLRCNGADVSKTTYAALYAIVGDSNNNQLQIGAGQPWRQQYSINESQAGDISGWATATSLPSGLSHSHAVVTKDRLYLLGGYAGSRVATVYTASINADGTLGAWGTTTSLPAPVYDGHLFVTKNRIYLAGGGNNNVTATATVYTAAINADGGLSTWSTTNFLPSAVMGGQVVITSGYVYILGGSDTSGPTSTIIGAAINTDGTLGAWSVKSNMPVTGLVYHQAIITKNRIYVMGGSVSGGTTNNVYTAPINPDGTFGSWTNAFTLPNAVTYHQALVTKNSVYLFGGAEDNQWSSKVYVASINADGTLGSWSNGTALPVALANSQVILVKGKIYLLGGENSSTAFVSTVLTASIAGGTNDYSAYYTAITYPVDSANFRLPDYSASELPGSYSYIKF